MALRRVMGKVKMLGNSTSSRQRKNMSVYSVIEMTDGHLIQGVRVSDSLDNFLTRAFSEGGEATLWLHESRLLGLSFDGKTYIDRSDYTSPLSNYLMIGIALPFCFILIGFIFVFAGFNAIGKTKVSDEILAANPSAISV